MQIGAGEGGSVATDFALRLVVAAVQIALGVGLLLLPVWSRRSTRLRLQSSNDKMKQRHTLLFMLAGVAAVVSGLFLIFTQGDIASSLIPLGMIIAALTTALLPGGEQDGEEKRELAGKGSTRSVAS